MEHNEFYTSNGWKGSHYDSSKTTKQIAKEIRATLKKEFPDVKFSVRSEWERIYITVVSSVRPLVDWDKTTEYSREKHCISDFMYVESVKGLTDYGRAVLDKVDTLQKSYVFSDCDGMIDYFDRNFYCWFAIGSYDRPYECESAA